MRVGASSWPEAQGPPVTERVRAVRGRERVRPAIPAPVTTPRSLGDRDGLVLVQRSPGAGVQAAARAGDEEPTLCAGKECGSHNVIGPTDLTANLGGKGEPVVAGCERGIEHERMEVSDHGFAGIMHLCEVPKLGGRKRLRGGPSGADIGYEQDGPHGDHNG